VVDSELLLAQVIHDQVMDRAAGDGIPAEHLAGAQLPLRAKHWLLTAVRGHLADMVSGCHVVVETQVHATDHPLSVSDAAD
jgi:hypothetical protein